MRQTVHSFSELTKLEAFKDLNSSFTKEMEMENVAGYNNAVVSHYNHNKRFGFAKVTLPEGTELQYDISTTEGESFTAGHTLDKDVVIEAFVHASVVANAGYEFGLNPGDTIPVKIDNQEKGIQVTKIRSINTNTNAPRPSNEFLKFVIAKVKMRDEGKFGFVSIESHWKTGEPLDTPVDAYFNWHLLSKAQYDTVKKDDLLIVKYYTYPENGRSTVCQIMYLDKATKLLDDLATEADSEQEDAA